MKVGNGGDVSGVINRAACEKVGRVVSQIRGSLVAGDMRVVGDSVEVPGERVFRIRARL